MVAYYLILLNIFPSFFSVDINAFADPGFLEFKHGLFVVGFWGFFGERLF